MNDLDEIRKQLDELSDRVTMLESQMLNNNSQIMTVRTVAKEAERHVSGYRTEIREGFTKINTDLAQITALLRVALNAPAET